MLRSKRELPHSVESKYPLKRPSGVQGGGVKPWEALGLNDILSAKSLPTFVQYYVNVKGTSFSSEKEDHKYWKLPCYSYFIITYLTI